MVSQSALLKQAAGQTPEVFAVAAQLDRSGAGVDPRPMRTFAKNGRAVHPRRPDNGARRRVLRKRVERHVRPARAADGATAERRRLHRRDAIQCQF